MPPLIAWVIVASIGTAGAAARLLEVMLRRASVMMREMLPGIKERAERLA